MLFARGEEVVHGLLYALHFCLNGAALSFVGLLVAPGVEPSPGVGPYYVLKLVAVPQQHKEEAEPGVYEEGLAPLVVSGEVQTLHALPHGHGAPHAARVEPRGGLGSDHYVLAYLVHVVGGLGHGVYSGVYGLYVALHCLDVQAHFHCPRVSSVPTLGQVLAEGPVAYHVKSLCVEKVFKFLVGAFFCHGECVVLVDLIRPDK